MSSVSSAHRCLPPSHPHASPPRPRSGECGPPRRSAGRVCTWAWGTLHLDRHVVGREDTVGSRHGLWRHQHPSLSSHVAPSTSGRVMTSLRCVASVGGRQGASPSMVGHRSAAWSQVARTSVLPSTPLDGLASHVMARSRVVAVWFLTLRLVRGSRVRRGPLGSICTSYRWEWKPVAHVPSSPARSWQCPSAVWHAHSALVPRTRDLLVRAIVLADHGPNRTRCAAVVPLAGHAPRGRAAREVVDHARVSGRPVVLVKVERVGAVCWITAHCPLAMSHRMREVGLLGAPASSVQYTPAHTHTHTRVHVDRLPDSAVAHRPAVLDAAPCLHPPTQPAHVGPQGHRIVGRHAGLPPPPSAVWLPWTWGRSA